MYAILDDTVFYYPQFDFKTMRAAIHEALERCCKKQPMRHIYIAKETPPSQFSVNYNIVGRIEYVPERIERTIEGQEIRYAPRAIAWVTRSGEERFYAEHLVDVYQMMLMEDQYANT